MLQVGATGIEEEEEEGEEEEEEEMMMLIPHAVNPVISLKCF
jgi:hypothetical protein